MYRIDKIMDHWTSTKVVTLSRDTARTEYPDFFIIVRKIKFKIKSERFKVAYRKIKYKRLLKV